MVAVAVGEQRAGHPQPAGGDDVEHGGQMGLVQRPGVDHDGTRCDPGSASTHVLVPSRVIGPGLGASTQVARSLTTPPAQPPVTAAARSG